MLARFFTVLLIAVLLPHTCAAETDRDTVYQVSTLAALLDGHYDGETTLHSLRGKGDFGIGTFEGLDGEMILLDGIFYQARADGSVVKPDDSLKTPFACVTRFDADHELPLAEDTNYEALKRQLDRKFATKGLPYAIRVKGTFKQIRVRSVPAQKKPYPRLTEVVKQQPVFDYEDVEGTLVGFCLPPSLEGVNVPGYHLHLISKDTKKGGHLLAFTLAEGTVQVDDSPEVRLAFSAAAARAGLGVQKAKREEIERVEKEEE